MMRSLDLNIQKIFDIFDFDLKWLVFGEHEIDERLIVNRLGKNSCQLRFDFVLIE
jgi:hypothetical protein